MKPARHKTLRGLILPGACVLVALLALLAGAVFAIQTEFRALAQGDSISEATWSAWAAQPGAILWVLGLLFGAVFLVGCGLSYLAGHLFWQTAPVYAAERAGVNLDLAVPTALKLRAMFEAEAAALSRMTKLGALPMPVWDSMCADRARAATGGIYYPPWLREFARDTRALTTTPQGE